MSSNKRKKPPSAKQLKENLEFYFALKAMPAEKLGALAPTLEALTIAYNELLANEEELRRLDEALAASNKAAHEAHIALCDARIRAIREDSMTDEPDEPVASKPATLH